MSFTSLPRSTPQQPSHRFPKRPQRWQNQLQIPMGALAEILATRTCCQGVLPSNFVWLRIAAAAACSGRDLLDTDLLPGSTPQKLRVRTGCTPQSSSTLQQAVASNQTRLQGPCHDRGQDQPKIGDMHGQSQPFAKPCFGLAAERHLARVETHQRCQLPRSDLSSC